MHHLVSNVADLLLTILEWAMLIRALLSWFPGMNRSSFAELVYTVTEPLIAPVRSLLDRIPALRSFPLDVSFLLTYMLLVTVHGLL